MNILFNISEIEAVIQGYGTKKSWWEPKLITCLKQALKGSQSQHPGWISLEITVLQYLFYDEIYHSDDWHPLLMHLRNKISQSDFFSKRQNAKEMTRLFIDLRSKRFINIDIGSVQALCQDVRLYHCRDSQKSFDDNLRQYVREVIYLSEDAGRYFTVEKTQQTQQFQDLVSQNSKIPNFPWIFDLFNGLFFLNLFYMGNKDGIVNSVFASCQLPIFSRFLRPALEQLNLLTPDDLLRIQRSAQARQHLKNRPEIFIMQTVYEWMLQSADLLSRKPEIGIHLLQCLHAIGVFTEEGKRRDFKEYGKIFGTQEILEPFSTIAKNLSRQSIKALYGKAILCCEAAEGKGVVHNVDGSHEIAFSQARAISNLSTLLLDYSGQTAVKTQSIGLSSSFFDSQSGTSGTEISIIEQGGINPRIRNSSN